MVNNPIVPSTLQTQLFPSPTIGIYLGFFAAIAIPAVVVRSSFILFASMKEELFPFLAEHNSL